MSHCSRSNPLALLALSVCLSLVASAAGSDAPYRCIPLEVPQGGQAGFTLLEPSQTGLSFTNTLSDEKASENQIRLNGSGVALGDVDGDGRCDIYLCGLEGGNALFRNLGGWHFTNITASAGVACTGQSSTGAALVDVDGDGDLDLLVNGVGTGTRLFLNDGHGVFTEATNSGLAREFGATSLALADIDGDGALDLYVANYRTTTIRSTGFALLSGGGRKMIMPQDRDRLELTSGGRVLEHGEPDFLYRNLGNGHFAAISWTNGAFLDEAGHPLAKAPRDWGLSVMFRDLNGDGYPDLYVCNDFHSPDRIWLNDGRGHFRLVPAETFRHTPTFSMSVDFADVNRDGREDIFVADMLSRNHARRLMQYAAMDPQMISIGAILDRPQYDHSALQLNRGDGTYADVVFYAGLESSDWTWSAIFLDVDLDGYEDLLCACGHQFDTQDLDAEARIQAKGPWPPEKIPQKLLMFPRMHQPKLAFRNQGNLTFRECGATWGFNQQGVGQGMALADLDNDGDLDVVVNNLNGAVGIYRNNSIAPRVSVRLKGAGLNTGGIGARIRLLGGPVPVQEQERIAGGRYLSSDDGLRVFAAGRTNGPLEIQVDWRSGKRSVVTGVVANCEYQIFEESATSVRPPPAKTEPRPLFADVSALLRHTHHEDAFDDFQAQPLLPRRLSQLGPGVAWFDVDGDGSEELIIGGGRGGRLAVFHWDGQSQFQQLRGGVVSEPFACDQSGLVGWFGENGQRWLLAGQMDWEGGSEGGVAGYDLATGKRSTLVAGWKQSVGPIAVGDIDGDGDLDVFVGGRVQAGHYPLPCRSVWYRIEGGKLVEDEMNTHAVANAGMVSGAVLSDLDGDGYPELILACEWGPIRVYHNDHGRFQEVTEQLGLAGLVGWWNGVATGDFDGDGRMDIVASNWGLNTKYQASEASPRRLYCLDLDGDGTLDLIEAYRDPITGKDLPERDLNALSRAVPMLAGRFSSHAAFGMATVPDILGDRAQSAMVVSANTLTSMVFLNRGQRFEARPLPLEAQLAPAFATVVADFDGDGLEDLFLSQNFFAYQPQTTRSDAGRGLLLYGDGAGGFRPVPANESGIRIYGEQRGAAAADYDGDGRADLVVTQNGNQSCLFHNLGAKPGLRVRLRGPKGNPHGLGAVIRLEYGGRLGPAREVHGGSGYWSQDSPTQVLGIAQAPVGIWVRWPGGKTILASIPTAAREIEVNQLGELKVLR